MTASVRGGKRPPPPLNCARVREVAALFFAKHEGRWSKERDWKRSLDLYVHPVIGNVAIADVGVPHVLKVVEPHWQRIPETARRVLGSFRN